MHKNILFYHFITRIQDLVFPSPSVFCRIYLQHFFGQKLSSERPLKSVEPACSARAQPFIGSSSR